VTILSVIRNVCQINGVPAPAAVVSSLDSAAAQLLAIANELLDTIAQDSRYQVFTAEALWTFLPQENQGSILDIAPGIIYTNNFTFYDRTLRRALYGPVEDDEWQALKAMPNPGPFYKFRIRGNDLLINPVPQAPLSLIAFEYKTKHLVRPSSGPDKQYFTADDDTCIFPENILQRGIRFRWKQEKGLPYQADEAAFYEMLNNFILGSKPRRSMLLHENSVTIEPGVFVPSGNWPVTP
jgi:hypothetical protein